MLFYLQGPYFDVSIPHNSFGGAKTWKERVILVETLCNPIILSLHAKINALVLFKSICISKTDPCLEDWIALQIYVPTFRRMRGWRLSRFYMDNSLGNWVPWDIPSQTSCRDLPCTFNMQPYHETLGKLHHKLDGRNHGSPVMYHEHYRCTIDCGKQLPTNWLAKSLSSTLFVSVCLF